MSTSESKGFKTLLSITFRITEKSNLTCLIQWNHQSGGIQIVFRKIFQLERFRSGFLQRTRKV